MSTKDRVETLVGIVRELGAMSDDELGVVHFVVDGLVKGATQYGRLDISKDSRDFRRDASEELRDCMVYVGAELTRLLGLKSDGD